VRRTWIQLAVSLLLVAAMTVVCFRFIAVNPTTVALSYLMLILLVATRWGLTPATATAVVSAMCFNIFFLPPVGMLTIADPENWVSFLAFMVTAIVASQISGRARERQVEAAARQRDLERLYSLSRALLLSPPGTPVPQAITQQIASSFEAPVVALYDRKADTVTWGGTKELPELEATLRDVARQAETVAAGRGTIVTAIRLGGAPIGSLAIVGAHLSDPVLQSILNLAAVALEQARGQEAAARAEAAQHSSELRTTVLDAIAHEFKTPLTSSQAAATDLLGRLTGRDHELVAIIDEDLDRLTALVTDAVHMLRIDAGQFTLRREPLLVTAIVATAVRDLKSRLDGHTLVNRVPADLRILADPSLLSLALRQLLDNAVKYSPRSSAIDVSAVSNGSIDITVQNTGSAIPEAERARIFERFYRGARARQIPGSGMGLAIVQQIAEAHGGTVRLSTSAERGTELTLSIPSGAATP
jgi:two-component system sensor histidine kinase KdpD